MTKETAKSRLVSKIRTFITRYCVVSAAQAEILSHFVLHTHQFSERCQQPYTTGYLFVNSAQKGSGKTLLGIDVMGALCRNFEAVNNVTPATLFRLTEMRATIGIDEVDMLFSGNRSDDDLVSTLNTGYRKGGYVPRADKNEPDGVKRYSTFAPKILIGIDSGTMKDTTRDRCIPINMARATEDERKTVSKFLSYKVEDELAELGQEIFNWSFEHTVGMRDYEPTDATLESISKNGRQQEIATPLLQVARVTGREKEMLAALKEVFTNAVQSDDTPEMEMLSTLQEMFSESDSKAIKSADLLARLHSADPRFAHWTSKMLGNKLAPFGIRVKPVRFSPSDVSRAIARGDCQESFKRYLGA